MRVKYRFGERSRDRRQRSNRLTFYHVAYSLATADIRCDILCSCRRGLIGRFLVSLPALYLHLYLHIGAIAIAADADADATNPTANYRQI